MRLVAPNGDVYSFGMEMPAESQEFLWENMMAKLIGTVTARINKAGDYEEFRPHEGRLVTSIPLTAQRADNIIDLVNQSGDIRFNFLRQNCSQLMTLVLKLAGYEVPTKTTAKEFFVDMLPDVKHIPFVGPVLDKVNQVYQSISHAGESITPAPIQNVFSFGKDIIFYIPKKIATVAINLLIRCLGGGKMLHALPEGVEDEELYTTNNRFLNFSRVIRSWTDIFKEQTQEIFHSKYFIDWQKQQRSTFIQPANSKQGLAIVPPIGV